MTVGTHSDRLALLSLSLTADPLGLKPSVADRLERIKLLFSEPSLRGMQRRVGQIGPRSLRQHASVDAGHLLGPESVD